jgi:hypothetical protein
MITATPVEGEGPAEPGQLSERQISADANSRRRVTVAGDGDIAGPESMARVEIIVAAHMTRY